MVLAPEHPLVPTLTHPDRREEVAAYVEQARRRTEIDRLSTDREKTGVALGADAINPVNGERIPIFIADYVLSATAPARSWPCRPTTSATSCSP